MPASVNTDGASEKWNRLVCGSGLFSEGDRVAAAVSGGRDSVCLLVLLAENREKLGIEFTCIHVNHGLRGTADRDAAFVEALCGRLGVPFLCVRADVPELCRRERVSTEEGARIARYRAFESLFSGGFDSVAIAHHAGDLVETALFNLVRGAGLAGMCSMKTETPARGGRGRYVRPLLNVTRAEIDNFLAARGQDFVEDETNAVPDCSRNLLRLDVLPLLERVHGGAAENILKFSERARETEAFLSESARKYLTPDGGFLTEIPPPLVVPACRLCLKNLGAEQNFSSEHALQIERLIRGASGKRIGLPGGVFAEKRYERIAFFRESNGAVLANPCGLEQVASKGPTEIPFGTGCFEFGDYRINISKSDVKRPDSGEKHGKSLRASADSIPSGAVIRSMRPGDLFRKFGGGTKKLCDVFTDRKLPRSERAEIPVLAIGNRILCVFPIDISEDLRVQDEKYYYFDTEKKENNQ